MDEIINLAGLTIIIIIINIIIISIIINIIKIVNRTNVCKFKSPKLNFFSLIHCHKAFFIDITDCPDPCRIAM